MGGGGVGEEERGLEGSLCPCRRDDRALQRPSVLFAAHCGGRTRISPGALRAEARPTVLLPADGFGVGFFFSIPSYDTREAICRVGGPTCRATLGSQDCPRTAALLSTNK